MTGAYLRRVAIAHQTLHWFIIGLLTPVLSLIQIEKGLNLVEIGFTTTVMSIAVVLLEVPTGSVADTIGRKRTYVLSTGVQGVGLVLLSVATGLPGVAVGLMLFGIARALSSGTMEAHFVDEFQRLAPEGDLHAFLARINIFVLAGLAVGGLIGGYLPETLGVVLARVDVFDRFSGNLIVAALIAALQALLTTILVRERSPVAGDERGAAMVERFKAVLETSFRIVLRDRLVLVLMIGAATWGVAFAGLETFWQPHLATLAEGNGAERTTAGGTVVFGLVTMGYFLAGAVGSALAVGFSRVFRGRLASVVAALRVGCGVLFVALSLQRGVGSFAVFYLTLFCLNGVAGSPEETLFNEAVPGRVRSTLLSFRSLSLQLGGAVGALVLGLVAEYRSIALAWQIAGAAFALSALLFVRAARGERMSVSS